MMMVTPSKTPCRNVSTAAGPVQRALHGSPNEEMKEGRVVVPNIKTILCRNYFYWNLSHLLMKFIPPVTPKASRGHHLTCPSSPLPLCLIGNTSAATNCIEHDNSPTTTTPTTRQFKVSSPETQRKAL